MASPIWFSRPKNSLISKLVMKGILLGVSNSMRNLINYNFFISSFSQILPLIVLSIYLFVMINGPIYFTSGSIIIINKLLDKNFNIKIWTEYMEYFITNFNLSIAISGYLRYYNIVDFDLFFFQSLKDVDYQKQTNFHKTLSGLRDDDHDFELRQLKIRHMNFYIYYTLTFALAHYDHNMSSMILAVMMYNMLKRKIGVKTSLALIFILQFFPKYFTFTILTSMNGCELLIQDLLMPFFKKISTTVTDKKAWLRTRESILLGFGLVNYTILQYCNSSIFHVFVYLLVQMNMGRFLTKIINEPPATNLYHWNQTQIQWNSKELLNEPFIRFGPFKSNKSKAVTELERNH